MVRRSREPPTRLIADPRVAAGGCIPSAGLIAWGGARRSARRHPRHIHQLDLQSIRPERGIGAGFWL